MNDWIALALRKDIVLRAFKLGVVVGTLLVAINYGETFMQRAFTVREWLQIFLTYLVPYGVCTYSCVQAILDNNRSCSDQHKTG